MIIFFVSLFIVGAKASIARADDHLEASQLQFLRFVLPDYFSKVSDNQLESITAYQTDEKLSYKQQKDETFRYLKENSIDREIVQHFEDYYKLEAAKRGRFHKFSENLAKAIDDYFAIYNKRDRPMRENKQEINALINRLEKPIAGALKIAINELESSKLLNASKKKTVTEGKRDDLGNLNVDI
ncbi:unnamed protein product, partial [Mesorhabditis belari]|uniref:DUF148 domain-containing protein n=1 Tax=Mesorhabditis belari TaxID=2138241 RepID=A0AAF3F657_9BILA